MAYTTLPFTTCLGNLLMLLVRDPNRQISLYFNVTNACNSACIFCAADVQGDAISNEIPVESILDAYKAYQLGPGDEVIVNGGEPTLYANLPDIILRASERQAKVILFTNGRLFRRLEFTRSVIEAGVFRISVALLGQSPETHDALTNHPGSLSETISGLKNVFSCRLTNTYPREIELKLLAVRTALAEWPAIVDVIARELGHPDILLLSGLNMWTTAHRLYDQISPTVSELRYYVNQTLKRADDYGMNVVLWSIPLCILNQAYFDRFTQLHCTCHEALSDNVQTVYFDPDHSEGFVLPYDELRSCSNAEPCRACEFLTMCGPGSVFMQQVLRISS